MIFAMFVLFVLLTVPLHALWVAGALWAPFNAFLCFRAAKKQGMDGWRYGVAGAIYAIFLFAPGMYLLMRLRGNTVQRPQIILAYVALYGLWCCALVGSSGLMFLATSPFDFGKHIAPYYGIFCVAMLLIAIVSGLELYALSQNKHILYRRPSTNLLLNRVQLTPFIAVWLGDIGWVMLMLRT